MEAELEILSDARVTTRIPVRFGQTITVGRSAPADVILKEDASLSNTHFTLRLNEQGCWLTDLGSRFGTQLNGRRVREAFVLGGSTIAAGSTTFLLHISHKGATVHDPAAAFRAGKLTDPAAASLTAIPVIEALTAISGPVFALLDAARGHQVLEILLSSGAQYQSLYEGPQGDELADWAPYLVGLPAGCAALGALVRRGWGRSWGVYLTSRLPFAEVRRHFRKFLLVKSEEDGRTLYFRYYDPRVLRLFLPSCTQPQATEFFGPVAEFLMEAADPAFLLRFTPGKRGAEQVTQAVLYNASLDVSR
jgi:hypothetical protein